MKIYMRTDGVVTVGIVTVGQTNPGSDSTSLRIPAELTGLAWFWLAGAEAMSSVEHTILR